MLGYLLRATLEGVFLFPPTACAFTVGVVFAVSHRLTSDMPFRYRELLLGLPLLFVSGLIFHGAIFQEKHTVLREDGWKSQVIVAVLILHLMTSGLLIWKLNGLRVYATSVLVVLTCFVLVAAVEAQMCVTNRWL